MRFQIYPIHDQGAIGTTSKDHACRPRCAEPSWNTTNVVRDQKHLGRSRAGAVHLAHQAPRPLHRHTRRDAIVRALVDDDAPKHRAGVAPDDVRRHPFKLRRLAGPVKQLNVELVLLLLFAELGVLPFQIGNSRFQRLDLLFSLRHVTWTRERFRKGIRPRSRPVHHHGQWILQESKSVVQVTRAVQDQKQKGQPDQHDDCRRSYPLLSIIQVHDNLFIGTLDAIVNRKDRFLLSY